jgi:putative transposase
MKKRFTEEQIIKVLTRLKNGTKINELAREIGVTPTTLYAWKKKYNDMTVNEVKRLRELEQENARLKRVYILSLILAVCASIFAIYVALK